MGTMIVRWTNGVARVLILTGALCGPSHAMAASVAAQSIPPDTVATVFTSEGVADFGAVGGVAVDALGYVYFADFQNALWRLGPDGELTRFAEGFYGASGNAVGPRGEIYQSSFNGNYVSRVGRDGRVETWANEGLAGPVGIAVNPAGELFVCNCGADNIVRVRTDGSVEAFSASDLFACPNGITFDDRGDLYVVNFNNTHVVRVSPDGSATSIGQLPGAGGNGHVTFARGGLYITKFRGEQVFRMERDGGYTVVAGTGARGEDDGDALQATFSSPNGIAAAPGGGFLFVNDLVRRPFAGTPGDVRLRRIRLVGINDVLLNVDAGAGPDAVRAVYAAYREARPTEAVAPTALGLAFRWLSTGRVAHAVALAEVNAESHPDDPASQFNLGEIYRYTGQPERAAAQYERTLALSPDHPQAAARLARVRGG